MSCRPVSSSAATAARSGGVTWVWPRKNVGSKTSASVGATLKSPEAGERRHSVPPAVTMRRRLVAKLADLAGRESGLGALDLLQADHIGLLVGQPVEEAGEAGLDRVDVPGREAHPPTLRPWLVATTSGK